MLRSRFFSGVGAVLAVAIASQVLYAQDAKSEKAEDKLPSCPVMGEPIDFAMTTATDDGPVYFCCKRCIKKYDNNPGKYTEKVAAQRATLVKRPRVQVSCPLTGEAIDKDVFAEADGKKVYFCCGDCKSKYAASPAKYAGKLAGTYTYQTKCPVMGGEIDPAVYADMPSGQRIYYCCPACDKKLKKDPKKYASKLAEQGIKLKVK